MASDEVSKGHSDGLPPVVVCLAGQSRFQSDKCAEHFACLRIAALCAAVSLCGPRWSEHCVKHCANLAPNKREIVALCAAVLIQSVRQNTACSRGTHVRQRLGDKKRRSKRSALVLHPTKREFNLEAKYFVYVPWSLKRDKYMRSKDEDTNE
eukprot:5766730-Pleurochrysis_carterae.AAC.1